MGPCPDYLILFGQGSSIGGRGLPDVLDCIRGWNPRGSPNREGGERAREARSKGYPVEDVSIDADVQGSPPSTT